MDLQEPVQIEDREDFVREALEDPFSSRYEVTCDLEEIFDFEVVEAYDRLSWGQSHIGTTLGTTVDYGRHKDMSDEELIEKNKDTLLNPVPSQFLGFMDEDREQVAETVVIVRKSNGYLRRNGLQG